MNGYKPFMAFSQGVHQLKIEVGRKSLILTFLFSNETHGSTAVKSLTNNERNNFTLSEG